MSIKTVLRNKKVKGFVIAASGLSCLTVLILVGVLVVRKQPMVRDESGTAEKIVDECLTRADKIYCYDTELIGLSKGGMEMADVFEITQQVQRLDPDYAYCHVLGHEVAAIEVSRNVGDWKKVLVSCPSGVCSNGCQHGAFQERFRNEVVDEESIDEVVVELYGVCEPNSDWAPTGLERGSCYHGMGHMAMYVTDADVERSIELCDRLVKNLDGRDTRPVCYDGVFMQIFQPLDEEDSALVERVRPNVDGAWNFCAQFDGWVRSSCWNETWPLFSVDELFSIEGINNHCSKLNGDGELRCYNALFSVMVVIKKFDGDSIIELCSGFEAKVSGRCFGVVVGKILESDWRYVDKAVAMCVKADQKGKGSSCWDSLVFNAAFGLKTGSGELERLCSQVPEEYKDVCNSK